MTKLTIVRGLPGSGKSTYAKTLDAIHIEADMFHVDRCGEYCFEASQIKAGHGWCRETTEIFLSNGLDVVVSNTFTQMWEMQPYIEFAEDCGFLIEVVRMTGDYGTIHGVPADIIAKMAARFESYPDETYESGE